MPIQSNITNNSPVPSDDGFDSKTEISQGTASRTVRNIIDEIKVSIGPTENVPSNYMIRLLNDGIHDVSVQLQTRAAQSTIDLLKNKRIYSFNDISDSIVALDIVKIEIMDNEGRYIMIPRLTDSYKLKGMATPPTSYDSAVNSVGVETNPNDTFSWYTDDDNFYIVYNQASDNSDTTDVGEYDTYNDNGVTNGLRIEYHLCYINAKGQNQDLQTHLGIPVPLHAALVDYMKSRLHEDMGSYETAGYHYQKYRKQVQKYPARLSNLRVLTVPKL